MSTNIVSLCFTAKCFLIFFLTIVFYYFLRGWIIYLTRNLSFYLPFRNKYPLSKITNISALIIITAFHIIFSYFFIVFIVNPSNFIALTIPSFILFFYGLALGLSIRSVSLMLCQYLESSINYFSKYYKATKLSISKKDGLIVQLYDAKTFLPFPLILIVIFIQSACEETVFRASYISYLSSHGIYLAVALSTFFFVLAESFFMPTKIHALFPMVSAAVMGLTHGYLFTIVPSIFPLVISQSVFTIFALY